MDWFLTFIAMFLGALLAHYVCKWLDKKMGKTV